MALLGTNHQNISIKKIYFVKTKRPIKEMDKKKSMIFCKLEEGFMCVLVCPRIYIEQHQLITTLILSQALTHFF